MTKEIGQMALNEGPWGWGYCRGLTRWTHVIQVVLIKRRQKRTNKVQS